MRGLAQALAFAAALALAGCGGGGGPSPPPPPRAASISISPDSATLDSVGATAAFEATVRDQRGGPFAAAIAWSSSDTAIFTVDADGTVTAAGNGAGTLTASSGSLDATASVTVEQAAAAVAVVSGDGQRAVQGSELPERIVVRVDDAGGTPVEGVTVTFTPDPGHGSASPATASTGADGQASTAWTLGGLAGAMTLTAAAPGGSSATIAATIAAEALPAPLEILTGSLPDAHVDTAYAATLRARGGAGAYAWTLVTGSLPAGLALSDSGEITGAVRGTGRRAFVVQVTDRAGEMATQALRLRTCEAPLELRFGDIREFAPTTDSNCGFALSAPEAGAYYRVTLVGRRHPRFHEGDPVALHVNGGGASPSGHGGASPPAHGAAPPRSVAALRTDGTGAVGPPPGDPHLERLADDRRLLARIAASGGPRPLATRADTAPPGPPPDERQFTRGSPGALDDNCTLNENRTGELMAFGDRLAVYAEAGITPPVDTSHAELLTRYYDDFGHPVIERYFGGVSDVDGDGRVVAFIDSTITGPVAIVWVGDLLSTDDCGASNQAELIRLSPAWISEAGINRIPGTVVHEAKHISSNYQWLQRVAGGDARAIFAESHPLWIEEGTAEFAREISSRLAWEAIGGPSPQQTVTGATLAMHDLTAPATHGIHVVLTRTKRALSFSSNSITRSSDPYGSGWHFHRFLGDWLGGAATSRLGDAQLLRDLNDAATPGGLEGIEAVTGRSFEDLSIAYATAVSLAGASAPVPAGTPAFTSYDFTGLDRDPFYEWPGRFPWPVTTSGSGPEAQLWVSLGASTWLPGLLGASGLRVHDFRADAAGELGSIQVEAPQGVRAVVMRLPDQSAGDSGGTGVGP